MSRKCRQLTSVDQALNVLSAHVFQVNHGGFQIAVPKPLLQGANTGSVFEADGCIGVTEFVKEPFAAVGAVGTLVAVP